MFSSVESVGSQWGRFSLTFFQLTSAAAESAGSQRESPGTVLVDLFFSADIPRPPAIVFVAKQGDVTSGAFFN